MPTNPNTIPQATAPTTSQLQSGSYGQVWWCRGPQPISFSLNGQQITANPKVGLITSPYCTVADVFTISVAQDQAFDYNPAVVVTWLGIGAAKINEWLGQRFNVPLTIWSDTVVWANSELAFVGFTRQRGINSEALVADFQAREKAVMSWLQMSRDHEVTCDQRLSIQDQPNAALQYFAQPARGWDAGPGYGYNGVYTPSPYAGNGAIGRYGAGGRRR